MERVCVTCGNIFHTKYEKNLCGACRKRARKVWGKEKLYCNNCFSSKLEPTIVLPSGATTTVKCLDCGTAIRINNTLTKSQLLKINGEE